MKNLPEKMRVYSHFPFPLNVQMFDYHFSGMLNRSTTTFDDLYVSMLDTLIKVVSAWNSYEQYGEKLTKLRSSLIEKGKRSFDAKSHQFNTLIHGDVWVNNTMYTYNAKNEPDKMMLVDFQFCCWTSPTIDLHYFINTSLNDNLRLNYQEELLKFYHSELSRMLTSLQYKKHIPTLHEFHLQFMENCFWGKFAGSKFRFRILNIFFFVAIFTF